MFEIKPVALCAMTIGASLFLLSGCGDNKRAAQVPNPELRSVVDSSELPGPPSADPAAAPGRRIGRGPRTQEEIDSAYAMPALAPVRPVEAQPTRSYVPLDTGDSVVADPSWEVQVTREWRHIVVHHSASNVGSAAIFDKAHKERGWDGLGYHFVIGNGSASGDGEVEVGYRWKRQMQGAHAGNAEYNQAGIGICLVGDFEHNGSRPSARQMASLARLVRFLQVKTGVPTSEIIGHGNVPGKSTECPGRNLNLGDFRASLGGGAIGVQYHLARDTSRPASSPVRLARSQTGSASLP